MIVKINNSPVNINQNTSIENTLSKPLNEMVKDFIQDVKQKIPSKQKANEIYSQIKDKSLLVENIDYTILEIEPSKITNNNNVRYLILEFARIYKPFIERIKILADNHYVIHTPEMNIWWEIVLTHNSIKFYLIVPNREGFKKAITRQIMKCWKQANVKETVEYMPKFNPKQTTISLMTLKYHEILSLDIENPTTSVLESLLNSKHYLQEGDVALFQMGLQSLGSGWNTAMTQIYEEIKQTETIPRKKGKKITKKELAQETAYRIGDVTEEFANMWGNIFLPDWEDTQYVQKTKKSFNGSIDSMFTRRKIRSDAFKATINIVAESPDEERRNAIVRSIASGFDVLEGDNAFVDIQLKKEKSKLKRLNEITNRIMPSNSHDILCSHELSKIINVPDKFAQIEFYNELSLVTNRGESETPREIFDSNEKKNIPFALLQDTDGKWKEIYFDTENKNNLCMTRVVIGEPGTGKSTFAVSLCLDVFIRGYGAFVIDAADGKLIQRILDLVPPNLKHKVKIIDFMNPTYACGLGWNEAFILDNFDIIQDTLVDAVVGYIELVAQNELNMIAKTWVENAVKAVFTTPDATLQDIENMINNSEYRSNAIQKIKDPELRMDWEYYHNTMTREERKAIYDQVYRRISSLIRKPSLKSFILQKPKKDESGEYLFNIRKWMDEGYLCLVKCNETLTEPIQTALVSFLLAKFNLAMISRENISDESNRNSCFLFLDEPDHYIKSSENWRNMLTRYRKYRCGLVFMFHGWQQLVEADRNLPKMIRKAGPHYIVYKTDLDNLLELQTVLEPEFSIKDLAKGIPNLHFVAKLKMYTPSGEPTPAFMAKSLPMPESRFKKYDNNDLYDLCAKELGKTKEEVAQDLFKAKHGSEFTIQDFSVETTAEGHGELKKEKVEIKDESEQSFRKRDAIKKQIQEGEVVDLLSFMKQRNIDEDDDNE